MRLIDFSAGGEADGLSISSLGADTELVSGIQRHLSQIGLLDPPADGKLGAVTQ